MAPKEEIPYYTSSEPTITLTSVRGTIPIVSGSAVTAAASSTLEGSIDLFIDCLNCILNVVSVVSRDLGVFCSVAVRLKTRKLPSRTAHVDNI